MFEYKITNKLFWIIFSSKDGMLDADEFALAMHLMHIKLDGNDLPVELPPHLIPPSKRGFWESEPAELLHDANVNKIQNTKDRLIGILTYFHLVISVGCVQYLFHLEKHIEYHVLIND